MAAAISTEGVEVSIGGTGGAVTAAASGRRLAPGDSFTIDTGRDSTTFALGLSWDEVKGQPSVDLDACCIALDANGKYLTTCYFGELKCFGNALVHSGDSRLVIPYCHCFCTHTG
jgi:hypothetical protein